MTILHFRWIFAGLLMAMFIVVIVMSREPVTLGLSAEWSHGRYRFAGGTDPWAIGFAVLIASLYVLLMNVAPTSAGKPLSGVFRRFVASWLDFVLAMSIFVPVLGILLVFMEWRRTKVFAWTFERSSSAAFDRPLAALLAGLIFAAMLFYYALPLVRRRPSPGACIVGYQVVAEGAAQLNLRRALARTSLGFVAVCAACIAPFVGRDRKQGKFWLDKVFDTRATLLN